MRTAAAPAPSGREGPAGASRSTAITGALLGFVGVVAFSGSFPATKAAVAELDPWLIAFGRAAVAAALAAAYLLAVRAPRPSRPQWRRLTLVAGGVVVGFPLLSSLALQTADSAHGAVVIALLPAATALAAVARAGERPGPVFWVAALAGLGVVLAFVLAEAGGTPTPADLLLLAATAVCAVGYAEGGALARELGGARTICWGLLLAAPVTVPVAAGVALATSPTAGAAALAGFAYVATISMFLGFFAWYAGLARGGVARVGQLQLLQPLLTLALSALLLGEQVGPWTIVAAAGVLAAVAVTQRARIRTLPRATPAADLLAPGSPAPAATRAAAARTP